MKRRILRYLLTAAGVVGLAGAPALFAGNYHYGNNYSGNGYYQNRDLRHDYRGLERENADIRADRWRLHKDLERGSYRRADREREDLNRDRRHRDRRLRDIHGDQHYYGWR
jgi:hypothetical protein